MKTLLTNRKAQLGTLQGIIISVMIIGIFLGVGFLLFNEFGDVMGDTLTSTANETITLTELELGGVFTLGNDSINCFNSFVVTAIENSTEYLEIGVSNVSWDADSGMVWNISTLAPAFTDGPVNISYNYKSSTSEACDAIEETIDATQTIPQWLTIIIILLIVGILLFIIFKVVPRSMEGGGIGGMFGSKGGGGDIAEI